MKKKLTVLFLCVITLLFFAACNGNTVAEVNGVKISKDEYQQYMNYLLIQTESQYTSLYAQYGMTFTMDAQTIEQMDLKNQGINGLVFLEELWQVCDKVKCAPTDDEIRDYSYQTLGVSDKDGYEQAFTEAKSQYGTDEEMLTKLIVAGLYQEKLKDYLEEKKSITFTTDQAKELYEKDPESYANRSVSYILIQPDSEGATTDETGNTVYTDEAWAAAKTKAQKVIDKLDDGADFAEMAEKYSDDSSTASSGGVASGSFTKNGGTYVEEFTEAAFKLTEVGEYTEKPVKSVYGYFAIKCDGLQDVDNDFDALLKSIAADNLDTLKTDAFSAYMDKFDKKADVVYYYGDNAEGETAGESK